MTRAMGETRLKYRLSGTIKEGDQTQEEKNRGVSFRTPGGDRLQDVQTEAHHLYCVDPTFSHIC